MTLRSLKIRALNLGSAAGSVRICSAGWASWGGGAGEGEGGGERRKGVRVGKGFRLYTRS